MMRLWLTVAILVGVAAAGGSAIWWMFLSSYGERQLQASQQRLQAQGYTLHYREAERAGFPLELEWVVHDVTVSHPGNDTGQVPFSGRADRVRFVSAPWEPQRIAFQVEGRHAWQVETDGGAGVVDIAVDAASGVIEPLDAVSGWRVETRVTGVTARPQAGAAGDLRMRSAVIVAETPVRMDELAVDARLNDIALPQDFGLGKLVESLRVTGDVRPLPTDYSADGLRAWQVADGRLSVTDAQLRFGPLEGSARGAVALDQGLRPLGDVTVQVQRPAELLALARQQGWIAEKQMPLYAMAAGLFTRTNGKGEEEATVQVGFRQGGIWLGPLRLGDLPPVVAE